MLAFRSVTMALVSASCGLAFLPSLAHALTCADLDGASVLSAENPPVYLGFFGTPYATDSIDNPYSTYGSQYNILSVRDPFGQYGSPTSPLSATNPYAISPPLIYSQDTVIAQLTSNAVLTGGVSLSEIDGTCPTFTATAPGGAVVNPPPPAFSIVPGITGNWYNQSQSGHGFAFEVLPGNQFLAEWYVFAPTQPSTPTWILGVGPISGNTAVVQAVQSVGPGGLFPPNFNAGQVNSGQPWGTLTFTFSDCNTGHVHWTSTAPGYPPSGDLDLVRLTSVAGLTCP